MKGVRNWQCLVVFLLIARSMLLEWCVIYDMCIDTTTHTCAWTNVFADFQNFQAVNTTNFGIDSLKCRNLIGLIGIGLALGLFVTYSTSFDMISVPLYFCCLYTCAGLIANTHAKAVIHICCQYMPHVMCFYWFPYHTTYEECCTRTRDQGRYK